MSTPLDNRSARWVHMTYISETHTEKIKRWIAKHNLDIEARGVVMNPRTFEAMQKWFILTEEDKVFFLLKWR